MEQPKIKITTDEIADAKVDARLAELDRVRGTKRHYESAEVIAPVKSRPAWWFRPAFYLCLAGLLGGLLGWGAGTLLGVRPDIRAEARMMMNDLESIERARLDGRLSDDRAMRARELRVRTGAGNPYFAIQTDPSLDAGGRAVRLNELAKAERERDRTAELLTYACAAVLIGLALSSAERVIERNSAGATISASVGAIAGLLGGAIAALAGDRISDALIGSDPLSATLGMRVLRDAIIYGLLGLFIGLAPGIVMRSGKRTIVGMLGGLVGGCVGGALVVPIERAMGMDQATVSRLIALLVLGGATGLAWGAIESATKRGWLRVARGLIAGKQFILYRDPTFIGSSPMSHVYLFKDPTVGRRHAAIHRTREGFEIENLPMGSPTKLNDRPVARARLRHGDRIDVGQTTLVFETRGASS